MAVGNALYDKGREGFLDGSIDWDTDNIKAVLVDDAVYAVTLTKLQTHSFLSDIPSGARIATSGNLTNKTKTSGIADSDDTLFSAVTGTSVEGIALYKDTGTASTSRLIAWIDTATGLPVTPNGSDITVIWDNGANKIFKL